MTADGNLSDKRVEPVKDRIKADLVDARGNPADPEEIDTIVDAKAANTLRGTRQEFTPVLIDTRRDELRQHGSTAISARKTQGAASSEPNATAARLIPTGNSRPISS